MQFNLRALREGLVHVEIFSHEREWIDRLVVDLVMKEVVEVGGVENVFPLEKILLNSGFEGAHALRLEAGIGLRIRRARESFFEARLLESGGIGKTQASSGENFSSAPRQQS